MWFFSLQNLKNQPVAKLVLAKFIFKACQWEYDNLHADNR